MKSPRFPFLLFVSPHLLSPAGEPGYKTQKRAVDRQTEKRLTVFLSEHISSEANQLRFMALGHNRCEGKRLASDDYLPFYRGINPEIQKTKR